jgi:hypothetical protein
MLPVEKYIITDGSSLPEAGTELGSTSYNLIVVLESFA